MCSSQFADTLELSFIAVIIITVDVDTAVGITETTVIDVAILHITVVGLVMKGHVLAHILHVSDSFKTIF